MDNKDVHAKRNLKKTTKSQFELLVELIDQNPELGKGFKSGYTKQDLQEKWEEISVKLNSLGPPTRKTKEWKRVWDDFKRKVKEKLAKNKKEISATGGGRYFEHSLSPLEQTVSSILQLPYAANPSGSSCGLNTFTSSFPSPSSTDELLNNALVEIEYVQNITPNTPVQQKTKQKENTNGKRLQQKENINDVRMQCLQNQTETQEKILQVMKNVEKHAHDMVYELRKIRKLKEEKVKLLKERLEMKKLDSLRKEQNNASILELKKIKVEIEQSKLNLKSRNY